MSLKRHTLTLLTALLVASYAPTLYAQVRIAVVDLQRALNETEDGRQAQARLKKLSKRRQTELDAAQEKLKKMKDDIEKQKSVLNRDALQKRVDEYQAAFMELQTQYVEYQRELASKEAELTKRILDRMQEILRRIGQTEGYTLIVEVNEGGVVWVPSNLDVTDTLIQRYNSEARASPTPAAGGAAGAKQRSGGKAAPRPAR
jgi:outer membrane protein